MTLFIAYIHTEEVALDCQLVLPFILHAKQQLEVTVAVVEMRITLDVVVILFIV